MLSRLFRNARIYTPGDPGRPLGGPLQGKLTCFSEGALLCRDGLIERVGPGKAILAGLKPGEVELEVDCAGRCLVPGFVDPHTHMCFAETREQEFGLRLQGVSYLEILEQGGGILSSVRSRAGGFRTGADQHEPGRGR